MQGAINILFYIVFALLLMYFIFTMLIKLLKQTVVEEQLTAKGRQIFIQCYGRLYNKVKPKIMRNKLLAKSFDEQMLFSAICSALFADSFEKEIITQYKKLREAKNKITKYEEYKEAHKEEGERHD